MNNIENYIRDNLIKGLDLNSIKKKLYSAGYSREHIDNTIKGLYHKQVVDLARYIHKELSHGISPGAVKNYLTAIGHPSGQVDRAVEKIIRAKRYLLRKKKIEKTKEQFKEIKKNIRYNLSRIFTPYWSRIADIWGRLKPWQRGAFIPSAVVFIILFFWEIIMITNSIILSGSLNCYSFGRVITCSFFESLLFYVLLMLALIIIFCLPVFGIGALIGYIIGRFRE